MYVSRCVYTPRDVFLSVYTVYTEFTSVPILGIKVFLSGGENGTCSLNDLREVDKI